MSIKMSIKITFFDKTDFLSNSWKGDLNTIKHLIEEYIDKALCIRTSEIFSLTVAPFDPFTLILTYLQSLKLKYFIESFVDYDDRCQQVYEVEFYSDAVIKRMSKEDFTQYSKYLKLKRTIHAPLHRSASQKLLNENVNKESTEKGKAIENSWMVKIFVEKLEEKLRCECDPQYALTIASILTRVRKENKYYESDEKKINQEGKMLRYVGGNIGIGTGQIGIEEERDRRPNPAYVVGNWSFNNDGNIRPIFTTSGEAITQSPRVQSRKNELMTVTSFSKPWIFLKFLKIEYWKHVYEETLKAIIKEAINE